MNVTYFHVFIPYAFVDLDLLYTIFCKEGKEMSLLHGTWTHLLSAEVKQGGSWYRKSYEVLTVTARRRCDCAGWGDCCGGNVTSL